jgi:hypothetical protein
MYGLPLFGLGYAALPLALWQPSSRIRGERLPAAGSDMKDALVIATAAHCTNLARTPDSSARRKSGRGFLLPERRGYSLQWIWITCQGRYCC